MEFKLHSEYKPTGDQPQAIKELVDGFKPTLIIAHNKTLEGNQATSTIYCVARGV